MDVRQTYRIQQQYYCGFNFFPIRGLKKHNYFMYKVYAGSHKVNSLFDSVLNNEVLDTNYIVAIRKKLVKGSVPQTRSVVTELRSAQEALSELMRVPSNDKRALLLALGGLRSLERTLTTYQDAQHKLIEELKQLLSGKHFSSLYRTSSEDIGTVMDILQQMSDGIQCSIDCLLDFNRLQPLPVNNRPVALMAKYYVTNLVDELKKLLQVQQVVIHQLHGWKCIRQVHEQQEVLN